MEPSHDQPINWDQLSSSLQSEVRSKLKTLADEPWAESVFVVFNPRLKSTAGRARPREGIIELNPRLVILGDDHLHETLWHEAAHLLAHRRHRIKRIQPHGSEWRKACADLGIPGAKATHQLPLPRTRQRPKFLYRCPECGTEIERVKRIRSYVACHACCKAHNKGRYSPRFRLEEFTIEWSES